MPSPNQHPRGRRIRHPYQNTAINPIAAWELDLGAVPRHLVAMCYGHVAACCSLKMRSHDSRSLMRSMPMREPGPKRTPKLGSGCRSISLLPSGAMRFDVPSAPRLSPTLRQLLPTEALGKGVRVFRLGKAEHHEIAVIAAQEYVNGDAVRTPQRKISPRPKAPRDAARVISPLRRVIASTPSAASRMLAKQFGSPSTAVSIN
jgi:hypothetical protein